MRDFFLGFLSFGLVISLGFWYQTSTSNLSSITINKIDGNVVELNIEDILKPITELQEKFLDVYVGLTVSHTHLEKTVITSEQIESVFKFINSSSKSVPTSSMQEK